MMCIQFKNTPTWYSLMVSDWLIVKRMLGLRRPGHMRLLKQKLDTGWQGESCLELTKRIESGD